VEVDEREVLNIVMSLEKEIKHVEEVLIPDYKSIGPVGAFGLMNVTNDLDEAKLSLESRSVDRMNRSIEILRECK